MMTTLLDLSDVTGSPRVKLVLPIPLRIGDRLKLAFKMKRLHNGRTEIMDVQGEYRVQAASLSAEHQHLSVEAVGKAPAWKAVRKETLSRKLPPARFPPTTVV